MTKREVCLSSEVAWLWTILEELQCLSVSVFLRKGFILYLGYCSFTSVPLKESYPALLAKEHFLSVWALSLPSCFLTIGGFKLPH